jgi:hypothetical protein
VRLAEQATTLEPRLGRMWTQASRRPLAMAAEESAILSRMKNLPGTELMRLEAYGKEKLCLL